jgi:hypothetical protein
VAQDGAQLHSFALLGRQKCRASSYQSDQHLPVFEKRVEQVGIQSELVMLVIAQSEGHQVIRAELSVVIRIEMRHFR